MERDIRSTDLYKEIESLWKRLRQPGTGLINDATEPHVSPDSRHVVFTGTLTDQLEGTMPTRICSTDLVSGDTRVLTFGPNIDRLPKFAPGGRHIAFLSDRHRAGDFQLYLLDVSTGAVSPTAPVPGWVEYLHWSPDGRRVLLGVAGFGADVSGGQGAITTSKAEQDVPAWTPTVETGDESYHWRHAWVYDLSAASVRKVDTARLNIWEAAWCGNNAIAAVTSPGPGEGLWYTARLHIIELDTASAREVYVPQYQLGLPAASPNGERLAVIEAICSDRGIVAGDLRLIDTRTGRVEHTDALGIDITYCEWRSDRELLLAGQRGFETVIGVYGDPSRTVREIWASTGISTGGYAVTVSGCYEPGDCALIGEGFMRAPEIALIRQGHYRTVRSFDHGYSDEVQAIEAVERVTWKAPDGLDIQGWLLRPRARAPHPVLMNIHGGPVWHWRSVWLGRQRGPALLTLIKHGYAVFCPNPRGSSGRGMEFTGRILGDMCGADTYDYLSGLDHLVQRGIADPHRLGVTGGSYGGLMSSWLITQDPRFAAAVALAPVSNQMSQRLICNIPQFIDLFLADTYRNAGGKYLSRSPIMHAHKAKTPVLNICGALDRCTPPEEAVQFHNALLENGTRSVLLIYPQEGHGIRKLPAVIDYAARVVSWFEAHMPRKSS